MNEIVFFDTTAWLKQ